MTLAATRAKLEQATRRESAAAGLASSAKRLPPARVVGQAGAVVGVADPARRAQGSSSSISDTTGSDSSLKSSNVQLKPLLLGP